MIQRIPYVYIRDRYQCLERLVEDEIDQLTQAGYDTTAAAKELEAKLGTSDLPEMQRVYESLKDLPLRSDYRYREPNGYEEIVAEREGKPAHRDAPAGAELEDRILGAWLGRCAGNCLGRPVENWSKEEIKARLDLSGDYPLENYFPVVDPVPESTPTWLAEKLKGTAKDTDLRPNIKGMVRDDDTDYTIIGLDILEHHGRDFATNDVGGAWLRLFPFKSVHTAERVAYINLVNNVEATEAALSDNPYREWIGAQIRADMWGYINPGDPEAAAEMAHRDAILSHTANGIYGEMAAAAMIAAAFTSIDPQEIIRAGMSVVPGKSRLAETLAKTIEWSQSSSSWEAAWEKIDSAFVDHHPVHTLPNIAIVALSMLFGAGDFEKTIAISVMAGFDTDCNGATVGSIIGAMLGAKALPAKWIDPLSDSIRSEVAGYDGSRISELAKRTVRFAG